MQKHIRSLGYNLLPFIFLFLFTAKADAQCATVYFEDFRLYDGFDIDIYSGSYGYPYNNYNELGSIYVSPYDFGAWEASDGGSCGTLTNSFLGVNSTIVNGGASACYLGQNVGFCQNKWIAPDPTGWISLSGSNVSVMLTAAFGRSSNMKSTSFIKFEYELNNNPGILHDWDPTMNLIGSSCPTLGKFCCLIPAGSFDKIRLYITIANDGSASPAEYHWFDNVKVEECSCTPSNYTFANPTLTFPNLPAVPPPGCVKTTLRFTQTLDYLSTCAHHIESGVQVIIDLPSSYDASGCTCAIVSATQNGVVGQTFSFTVPASDIVKSTNQVKFQLLSCILNGTLVNGVNNIGAQYDGATFTIDLCDIVLGCNLPNASLSVVNNSGGTNSATYPPPTPSAPYYGNYCALAATITMSQNGDTLFCTPTGAYSYQWYFNGSPISGATGSFYVPLNIGAYSVYITNHGCSAFAATTTWVGINEQKNNLSFQIYPNPAKDQFTVSGLQFSIGEQMKIFSIVGALVYSQTINQKQEIVNCKLTPGIYFLEISNVVRKVVIE